MSLSDLELDQSFDHFNLQERLDKLAELISETQSRPITWQDVLNLYNTVSVSPIFYQDTSEVAFLPKLAMYLCAYTSNGHLKSHVDVAAVTTALSNLEKLSENRPDIPWELLIAMCDDDVLRNVPERIF